MNEIIGVRAPRSARPLIKPIVELHSADERAASATDNSSTYLHEIGNTALLTRGDEQRLARALEAGAYIRVVQSRLGSVVNVPSAWQVFGACYEQLLNHLRVVTATCPPTLTDAAGYLHSLHRLGQLGPLEAEQLRHIAKALDLSVEDAGMSVQPSALAPA